MKKIIVLLVFSCTLIAFGQTGLKSQNKQAQKLFEQANQLLTLKQHLNAIQKLEEAISEDSNFLTAYQQLGDIYRLTQQYDKASLKYKKLLEIKPDFHSSTYFGLAESELKTGNYLPALEHFRRYLSFTGISAERKKLVDKYISDCLFSLEAIKKPVPFKPVNLGAAVNTSSSEYLPVLTADEGTLIFTRRRNNNEDFYQSKKQGSEWSSATYLSTNINTGTFNEGAQCITPDGMYLFFTGCNRPDGLGRCDIYVCRREGKEWSKPFNLGAPINGPGWESQPSITADGRTLYFISTRPGGHGGYDIWKTTLQQSGSWSPPENLGASINTPFDEESAFIHPDGKTLYFSSTGWPGLGGRDLFVSKLQDNGEWTEPVNLGYPINTYQDEGGLSISTDGKSAYFSSNQQDGYGEMDIYTFELPQAVRPAEVTYVKGNVFDVKTKEPLDAAVKIIELSGNSLRFDDHTDNTTGEFLATMLSGKKYALTVDKPGYLFYSRNFNLDKSGTATQPFQIDVPLQKVQIGGSVVLANIFFETNKSELLPDSKAELSHLLDFLNSNPGVSVEIGGHTDNVGEDKINQILSESRAKTVYNYLISHKINPSRLSFKGYGESTPVAENTSEEGRQKNRRTEFKIVKY